MELKAAAAADGRVLEVPRASDQQTLTEAARLALEASEGRWALTDAAQRLEEASVARQSVEASLMQAEAALREQLQERAVLCNEARGDLTLVLASGDSVSMKAAIEHAVRVGLEDDASVVAARVVQGRRAQDEAAATAKLEAAMQSGDHEELMRAVGEAQGSRLADGDTLSRAQQLCQMQHEARVLAELEEAQEHIRTLEDAAASEAGALHEAKLVFQSESNAKQAIEAQLAEAVTTLRSKEEQTSDMGNVSARLQKELQDSTARVAAMEKANSASRQSLKKAEHQVQAAEAALAQAEVELHEERHERNVLRDAARGDLTLVLASGDSVSMKAAIEHAVLVGLEDDASVVAARVVQGRRAEDEELCQMQHEARLPRPTAPCRAPMPSCRHCALRINHSINQVLCASYFAPCAS